MEDALKFPETFSDDAIELEALEMKPPIKPLRPPAKKLLEALRLPETLSDEPIDDEALEMKPLVSVARLLTLRLFPRVAAPYICSVPEALMLPLLLKLTTPLFLPGTCAKISELLPNVVDVLPVPTIKVSPVNSPIGELLLLLMIRAPLPAAPAFRTMPPIFPAGSPSDSIDIPFAVATVVALCK